MTAKSSKPAADDKTKTKATTEAKETAAKSETSAKPTPSTSSDASAVDTGGAGQAAAKDKATPEDLAKATNVIGSDVEGQVGNEQIKSFNPEELSESDTKLVVDRYVQANGLTLLTKDELHAVEINAHDEGAKSTSGKSGAGASLQEIRTILDRNSHNPRAAAHLIQAIFTKADSEAAEKEAKKEAKAADSK
ncbi:hypothetical protein Illi2_00102 [Pseudomonas phage vB_PpuM-Illi-2]